MSATLRRFVLFASRRTGSTNLALTLDRHPHIVCGNELLNPDDKIWDWYQIRRPDMTTAELLEAGFTCGSVRYPGAEIECIGYKVLDYQVDHDSQHPDAVSLLAEMKGLYVLILTRRNLLECVRSDAQARLTQTYHWPRESGSTSSLSTVRLEYDECNAFFLRTERLMETINAHFTGFRKLQLVYEDLYGDFDRSIEQIESFLEVKLQPLEHFMVKQENRPLCEAIENYYELKTAFQDSKYQRFFT
jgi:LPS sulfotransferase NodH